jgi:hypothetical protein
LFFFPSLFRTIPFYSSLYCTSSHLSFITQLHSRPFTNGGRQTSNGGYIPGCVVTVPHSACTQAAS